MKNKYNKMLEGADKLVKQCGNALFSFANELDYNNNITRFQNCDYRQLRKIIYDVIEKAENNILIVAGTLKIINCDEIFTLLKQKMINNPNLTLEICAGSNICVYRENEININNILDLKNIKEYNISDRINLYYAAIDTNIKSEFKTNNKLYETIVLDVNGNSKVFDFDVCNIDCMHIHKHFISIDDGKIIYLENCHYHDDENISIYIIKNEFEYYKSLVSNYEKLKTDDKIIIDNDNEYFRIWNGKYFDSIVNESFINDEIMDEIMNEIKNSLDLVKYKK